MISIIRAGTGPGVPHRVHLAARLGDVAAGAQDDLTVAGPEPDLALGDDRVLVLQGVQVRGHQRADRERVLDDRDRAVGLAAPQLELHPDACPGSPVAPSPGCRTVSAGASVRAAVGVAVMGFACSLGWDGSAARRRRGWRAGRRRRRGRTGCGRTRRRRSVMGIAARRRSTVQRRSCRRPGPVRSSVTGCPCVRAHSATTSATIRPSWLGAQHGGSADRTGQVDPVQPGVAGVDDVEQVADGPALRRRGSAGRTASRGPAPAAARRAASAARDGDVQRGPQLGRAQVGVLADLQRGHRVQPKAARSAPLPASPP